MRTLAYFECFADPVADEILGDAPDIDVVRMTLDQPEDEIAATLAGAHGFQLMAKTEHPPRWFPTADLIAQCPNLLALATLGAGYDMVDVAACTDAGVLVVNNSGANSDSVAQHAVGMMLALSKQMVQMDRLMRREAGVDRFAPANLGRELTGKTVGIVGLGNIGRRVARICGDAFGMNVIAYDPYITDADFAERGATPVGFEELFRDADFVTVHCPLTDETRGMIHAQAFGAMKQTAYFISTARGFIHDEAALIEILSDGRIAGAGMDVFDVEPPGPGHPLMAFENVLMTPHSAGVTDVANRGMGQATAEQWIDILSGRRAPRIVNPDVWPAYLERYRRITGEDVLD